MGQNQTLIIGLNYIKLKFKKSISTILLNKIVEQNFNFLLFIKILNTVLTY